MDARVPHLRPGRQRSRAMVDVAPDAPLFFDGAVLEEQRAVEGDPGELPLRTRMTNNE